MARSYAKAYDDVWGDKRLSNNDVMVYTGLVRHSYGDSMTVKHLGIRKLAEYCRVTVNTFQSCVKHLVECGWLEVVDGNGGRKDYNLLAPDTVEEDTTPSEKPDTPRPVKQKTHKTLKRAKKPSSSGEDPNRYLKEVERVGVELKVQEDTIEKVLNKVRQIISENGIPNKKPEDLFMAYYYKYRLL